MPRAAASARIPSSLSTSSSFWASAAGRGVAGPKPQAEETVPPVVGSSSSSSSSLPPAATSVPVKQEVKAKAVDPTVNSDGEARVNNDWEPGTWCWLLDEQDNWNPDHCNSTPVVAVKVEEAVAVVKQEKEQIAGTEERNEKISNHTPPHDVMSASPVVPAFSSSPFPAETKLLPRRDEEEEQEQEMKAEQNEDAIVLSASQFVASSFQLGKREVYHRKLRPDNNSNNNNNDDDDNNHKIRHSTDRSVKSDRNSDDGDRSSSDNTNTNTSTLGTNDPDPCDDHWRAGSWCWVPAAPTSGSRSDAVASVAAGSTGSKKNKKRKAFERAPASRSDDKEQTGETGTNKCDLDDDNGKNNQNNTIAVTNRNFDRQQRDPCNDNWTTSCWCWEPPSTNSGISGVALAAATAVSASTITSTRRREKQQRSEQSRESKCIHPSKNHNNIGHRNNNDNNNNNNSNFTNRNEDNDADDILECCGDHDENDDDDDDDNGTDSDYDSVDNDDERVSDNASRGNGIVVTRETVTNSGNKICSDNTTFHERRWNEMYSRLVKYKKTYKSLTVTKKFNDKYNLQQWTKDQRSQYNRKKLCANRIKRLNSVDFVWDPFGARWTEKYDRLVKYKKQHKSTCVIKKFDNKHNLQQWTWDQRTKYNRNLLSFDQINRLESIGFMWNVYATNWMETYKRLVAYQKQFKTTCVPFSYTADPPLGQWAHNQRTDYNSNKSRLTVDRINELNSIGFVWNVYDAQWTEMYDRLVKYKKEYNTTCVPKKYQKDTRLGGWVCNQRTYYNTKKSSLTADRITQLDSIGFVWNHFDAQWNEKYDRLVKYKTEYNTTCVPLLYPEDLPLGRWVGHQRTLYNTNNPCLTADRISRLDSISFVWKMRTNNVYL